MSYVWPCDNGARIIHNQDLSGDVEIEKDGVTITIPGRELIALVAYEVVRPEKIRRLEQAENSDEILFRL